MLPLHNVVCAHCGLHFQKRAYLLNPSCAKCTKQRCDKKHREYVARTRQQARRYRIVLHVLGWDDTNAGFEDMLSEMKKSPMAFRRQPETRLARLDLAIEHGKRRAV